MDVIPGRKNQFEVTPDRVGVFAGKCAELCGVDHSRMLFTVHVVSRADYNKHILELKAKGQSGVLVHPVNEESGVN
jgi:cytochrome c oxidase subunit 2